MITFLFLNIFVVHNLRKINNWDKYKDKVANNIKEMLGIILHLVCYDLWFYMSHIILHKKFYYLHAIHHMIPYKELTFIDANTAHIAEHVAQSFGIFIPLLVIKCSCVNFLGALLIINIRGAMRHDHRCSWLIGNHHLLHHKYLLYNYGEYWIDNLFGTCYPKSNGYIYGKVYT